MCETCIFRGGNMMRLKPGRVKEMVESATQDESAIVCHSTLHTGAEAVCRGFFDKYLGRRTRLLHYPEQQEAA
jgi:hypothetical protein